MSEKFHKISTKITSLAGSSWSMLLAILGVLAWAVTGPYFHFSNTWLISIATITDIIIFIMVFGLQHTQNRDSRAIQLKLDELIVANKQARDTFIGLESLTDEELTDIDNEFKQLLSKLNVVPAVHKLHKKVQQEKAHRFDLAEQAGHLVSSILAPFNDK